MEEKFKLSEKELQDKSCWAARREKTFFIEMNPVIYQNLSLQTGKNKKLFKKEQTVC